MSQCLKALFQENEINNSFSETVCLVARKPLHYDSLFKFCLLLFEFDFFYIPVNNFSVISGQGLPGLNQYKAADKVSCSRTQHSDSASNKQLKLAIPSLMLFQLVSLGSADQLVPLRSAVKMFAVLLVDFISLLKYLLLIPIIAMWGLRFSRYHEIKDCFNTTRTLLRLNHKANMYMFHFNTKHKKYIF